LVAATELRTRDLLSLRIYFVLRKIDMSENAIVPVERIDNTILAVRGHKVILDNDLALLYDVETKILNRFWNYSRLPQTEPSLRSRHSTFRWKCSPFRTRWILPCTPSAQPRTP
jgi:hypothetical protein